MSTPLGSLIAAGTKLWLDSVDPDLIQENLRWGATGATSNPVIVNDLIRTGRFDAEMEQLIAAGHDDGTIAWRLTDQLVGRAQQAFLPVWQQTKGNDGYVSFELDPLLEDVGLGLSHPERVARYLELGKRWSHGHQNRMIKVPATPAGLEALEGLAAAGVPLNVTLIFSARQYRQAREAIWRGAQRQGPLEHFKSVYSIFVSRIDIYTAQHVPTLSPAAQGMVGIVNAKRIWQENVRYWTERRPPLAQEIVFASTGTKRPEDAPWKYVEAFAGSDIETNPPATNDAVQKSSHQFSRQVDQLPAPDVLAEIDQQVDFEHMEKTLMTEGLEKFCQPQRDLLRTISQKRASLMAQTS